MLPYQPNNNPPPTPVAQPSRLKESTYNFQSFITNLKYQMIPLRPLSRALGTQTVGTVQVTVPHKMKRIPNVVLIQMTSAGTIWQSAPADGTNLYLTADSSSRTCNIQIFYFDDNFR